MSKEKKKTIDDIADQLVSVADDVLKGHVELPRAAEYNNTIGKLLTVYKLKLAAQALMMACESRGTQMESMMFLGVGEQKLLPSKT